MVQTRAADISAWNCIAEHVNNLSCCVKVNVKIFLKPPHLHDFSFDRLLPIQDLP